jgi:alkylhydroperoxidase/carboxymuconolactone decarboxylase family protein YurZ
MAKNKHADKIAREKAALFERSLKTRGFRYGLHKVWAEADWEFHKKHEDWVEFVYLKERNLDRRVKELVICAIIGALKSLPEHIVSHINAAVKAGATKEEVIEVFELCGHWGGTLAQANGLEAWRRAFAPDMPGAFQPMGAKLPPAKKTRSRS